MEMETEAMGSRATEVRGAVASRVVVFPVEVSAAGVSPVEVSVAEVLVEEGERAADHLAEEVSAEGEQRVVEVLVVDHLEVEVQQAAEVSEVAERRAAVRLEEVAQPVEDHSVAVVRRAAEVLAMAERRAEDLLVVEGQMAGGISVAEEQMVVVAERAVDHSVQVAPRGGAVGEEVGRVEAACRAVVVRSLPANAGAAAVCS